MTFRDLLDQVAGSAGDDSATYRADARRWLNLARSHIADSATWRSALDSTSTLVTSASNTSGIYAVTGYREIVGTGMFDETNDAIIIHESLADMNAVDVAKDVSGQPNYWADAGMSTAGVRQIYLWPIPDAAYTIRFSGIKELTDIGVDDDVLTVDPYFGPLTEWASCLSSGLRYYQELDDNEDAAQQQLALGTFERAIRRRRQKNTIATSAVLVMRSVRAGNQSVVGRFDPSHYNNRI